MKLNIDGLTDWLLTKIKQPMRICIAGFPSCGKSTLSNKIIRQINKTKIIESESWLHPLNYRIKKDISGSHPDSYDLKKCCSDLQAIFCGKTVHLPQYSHKIGTSNESIAIKIDSEDGVILDGTPFSLSCFNKFHNLSIFLYPKDYDIWIETSIERDVSTRYFSRSEATRHNMRKAKDMEIIRKDSTSSMFIECILNKNGFIYEVHDDN